MSDLKKVLKLRAEAQRAQMVLEMVTAHAVAVKKSASKKVIERIEDAFEDQLDVLWDVREIELKDEAATAGGKLSSDLKKHEEYGLQATLLQAELELVTALKGKHAQKRSAEIVKDLTKSLYKRDYYGAKAGVLTPEAPSSDPA